ncbi:MAG: recombinase zinc beta ribbon domain-containing protein [Chloroflexota bacterium]
MDRLARNIALLPYVIAKTIDIGATVYLYQDRMELNEHNQIAMTSIGGFQVTQPIRAFVESSKISKRANVQRGLIAQGKPVMSHTLIRDSRGKPDHLELDKTLLPMWQDVAILLLDGISWNDIEGELTKRFGYKLYGNRTLWRVVNNPVFWGHTARHHATRFHAHSGRKITGAWIFDPEAPHPEGIDIYYNNHEPVYKAELAEQVKAELRRRQSSLKGRASPEATYRYTGLLACNECKWSLAGVRNKNYLSWVCNSRRSNGKRINCSQNRHLSDTRLQDYVDAVLRQILAAGTPDLITQSSDRTPHEQIAELKNTIVRTEQQIANLIRGQVSADPAIQHIYAEQIVTATERLKTQRINLNTMLQRVESESTIKVRQQTFEALVAMGIEDFWQQESTRINQMLHRLFGDYRMMVRKDNSEGKNGPTW